MIRILNPADGASFPPGVPVPVSGDGGPPTSSTVYGPYTPALPRTVGENDVLGEYQFQAQSQAAVEPDSAWFTTFGPFSTTGFYVITVYASGTSDSVVIQIAAAPVYTLAPVGRG